MHLQEFTSAATFLEKSRRFLERQESLNNMILSSATTLSRNGISKLPSLAFFTMNDGEQITATLFQSPNGRVILSAMELKTATELGREAARRRFTFRSVFGPSETTAAFAEAYSELSGRKPLAPRSQVLMKLETLHTIAPSHGLFRVATSRDLATAIRWSNEFTRECELDETPSEAEATTRKTLEAKQLYIWEPDRARPVAMAAVSGLTTTSARISMVYTEPKARGHGHASTLVHRLSHRMQSEGRRHCLLFADPDNAVSVHVYEKLGYRKLEKFSDYRF